MPHPSYFPISWRWFTHARNTNYLSSSYPRLSRQLFQTGHIIFTPTFHQFCIQDDTILGNRPQDLNCRTSARKGQSLLGPSLPGKVLEATGLGLSHFLGPKPRANERYAFQLFSSTFESLSRLESLILGFNSEDVLNLLLQVLIIRSSGDRGRIYYRRKRK